MTEDAHPDPSHAAAIAERARIEPTAPPRRLDALPIFYLIGFLILAGSLVYLWRHPTVPSGVEQQAQRVDTLRQEADARRQELTALAGRIAQLEARPAAAPAADLGPIDNRLKALEDRPAPPPAADFGPIDGRLKALEARPQPPTVNLGPLEARVAAVEARRPVDLAPLEGRVGTLDGRLSALDGKLAEGAKQATEAAGRAQQQLAAVQQQLATVEAQGKETAAGLGAINDRARRAGRLMAAGAALEAGQRLGDLPGAPPAVARFANDAPPTEASLRLSFNAAADAAQAASQPAIMDNQPLLDRMWSRAQQSVTVRQGDRVLLGDPIAGVIANARQAVEAGDLPGAIKALSGLSGPARDAMAPWVARAQSLLDARAGLAAMAAG